MYAHGIFENPLMCSLDACSVLVQVMTILNQDLPEIRGLTDEEKNIMYAILDKGENTVTLTCSKLVFLSF